MATHNIKVNGKSQSVEVDSDTPLLWVLRDELNYVGTKYGCGIGQCGACTVHLDGNAARSCSVTVANPTDADIDVMMNGNICRCGTYNRIKSAIKSAAAKG